MRINCRYLAVPSSFYLPIKYIRWKKYYYYGLIRSNMNFSTYNPPTANPVLGPEKKLMTAPPADGGYQNHSDSTVRVIQLPPFQSHPYSSSTQNVHHQF